MIVTLVVAQLFTKGVIVRHSFSLGGGGNSYTSGDTVIINTGQRRKHHQHNLLIVVERLLPLMQKTNPKGDDVIMMSLYHMICIYHAKQKHPRCKKVQGQSEAAL